MSAKYNTFGTWYALVEYYKVVLKITNQNITTLTKKL